MKKIFIILILSVSIQAKAQECKHCGDRTAIAFQRIEWLEIQKPEDSVLLVQWEKLDILWAQIFHQLVQFFGNDNCLFIKPTLREPKVPNVVNKYKYTIYGIILQSSSDYTLRLWISPACSDKILAETDIQFQIYPFLDVDKIKQQAAAELGSHIKKLHDFELKEREAKNYGLGGDLLDGKIQITMLNKMVKGEETRVVMKVVDCDEALLKNKEISTAGTVGGVFTPAKFTTDKDGMATVKFRMTTDKTAFIKVACETKNVWGCDDLYTGTEVVKGLEGIPIKVSINYTQYDTSILKRATLPGTKIEGGDEVEIIEMEHRSVFYHFPSQKSLEEGFLVESQKEGYYIGLTDVVPDANTKTIYVTESGSFSFNKTVQAAKISAMAGGIEMVKGVEKEGAINYTGNASLQHHSEVTFHLGNQYEPPSFMWNVQYPASDGNIAGGGATIVKGEDGVQWKVNKITDPKSIYKTEYLLSLTLNAAEELIKGQRVMKQLFGRDLDEFTKTIDPTNPQTNMAKSSGSQTINVRILSPYEEPKSQTKK